ncbi:MAG: trigger factor [Nitrospira sp.]|nr:trigger factor [Nitrospira sp.]
MHAYFTVKEIFRRLNLLKSVEDITTTKKRIRIEIPSDIIEREIGSSFEKLKNSVKIPGFRPGKAPVALLEKRFGKEVEAEVLEKLVPEHVGYALREAALNPVTMPALDEKFEFRRNSPLNLSFTLEVLPDIGNLQYENLTVKDIPFAVEDSDVDDMLKRLQNQKAVFEVADKIIEMDDFVSFDYADGEILVGEPVPSLKEIISKLGNEILPPDLIEKAVGKKKGDIIEFTTQFDETFKQKELVGKTANIKLTINEIKKKTLPAIDDEFAKDLGLENMSGLREKLQEKLLEAKKQHIQRLQKAEIINKLIESHTFDVPESLINKELESLMMEKSIAESKEDSVPTTSITDILETATEGKKKEEGADDPEAKMKHQAMRNVQASVIINIIGKKEGITVSENEVNERVSVLAKKLSATPEAVKSFYTYKEGSLDGLKHSIYEEKVMELLLSKAAIETKEN